MAACGLTQYAVMHVTREKADADKKAAAAAKAEADKRAAAEADKKAAQAKAEQEKKAAAAKAEAEKKAAAEKKRAIQDQLDDLTEELRERQADSKEAAAKVK
jgi:colicin import membrane protein